MIKARVFPGDLLVVDRSITPANRHIVVVDIDGERSVKRLLLKGSRVRFAFEEPRLPALPDGGTYGVSYLFRARHGHLSPSLRGQAMTFALIDGNSF